MNNNMQAYFFYQLRIIFNGILTMEVNFSMQVRQVKDSVSVGKRIWCTQTPLLLMGSNQECMPWPNRGNSSQVNDMSKSYSFCLKVDEWVKKVRVFGGFFVVICGCLRTFRYKDWLPVISGNHQQRLSTWENWILLCYQRKMSSSYQLP